MKNLILGAKLLEAFAVQNPDGFTIDKNTLKPITKGFSVAVSETQNSFNTEGAAAVVNFANANENIKAFGGWYDKESGLFYYDAVIICNTLEEAVKLGKLNKQLAIFDLNKLQEIRL